MIGRQISCYLITESLGPSGNGDLYKAEDQRLDRHVVLKILSERWKDRSQARERFAREAKAASNLDHRNVCRIFEIGETDDGRLFTVTPYYGGRSVRDMLASGTRDLRQTLRIARQIADGLQKAHQADIVHRDVRPENLLVTYSEDVKILDFGLGRTGDTDASHPLEPTDRRRAFGDRLAEYRAPEQLSIQRQEVGPTADQWSLAAVIYEMLVARAAFPVEPSSAPHPTVPRSAVSQPAASDLTAPQPPSQIRPELPSAVDTVIARAMAPLPSDRYVHILDFVDALDAASQPAPTAPDLKHPSRLWPIVAAVSLPLLAIAYLFFQHQNPPQHALELGSTRPVVRKIGLEKHPSWGPDGHRLVYAGDQRGNMDIWVLNLESGASAPLTADFSGYDDHPVFSPDGQTVAFVSSRDEGGIYRIPATGGEAELIAQHSLTSSHDSKVRAPTLTFTPNGQQLIFSGSRYSPGLFIVAADGGKPRRLEIDGLAEAFSLSQPAISPDGRYLAFTEITGTATSTAHLWTLPIGDSRPVRITQGGGFNHHAQWTADGRGLLFISDQNGDRDLWSVQLDAESRPTGPARPLTVGVNIGSFDLSTTDRRLVYSKLTERSNLWALPISSQSANVLDASPLTSENQMMEFVDISPDGLWAAFDSNRGGNVDIWLLRLLDGELRQITRDPAHDWRPRFAPDGRSIVFYSLRSGFRNLWIAPIVGGSPRQLTDSPLTHWMPAWSPDSRQIAFDESRKGRRSIWIVDVDGNELREITPGLPYDAMYPIFSPDGNEILFTLETKELAMGLYRQSIEHGEPAPITGSDWASLFAMAWSPQGFIYAHGHRRSSDPEAYWEIHSDSGQARRLTHLESASFELMEGFTVHRDTLYFPLWELQGDLWMADLQKSR